MSTLPTTRTFHEVKVGDELPELVIELTPTVIISTAIASRDYQDVHHDRDLAQKKGSKDIFMNILTSNGFVGRYVTDWAGPNAVLRSVKIRLGVPNYAYDTMRMSARVETVELVDGEGRVEIKVRGANQLGDHVKGTVDLVLPVDGATA
ncbi:MAG: MaoC family dehydratase [Myxococcota bacterium]